MVHGFSRVVIEVLKFAARSTRLTIFVAESMPNREGALTVEELQNCEFADSMECKLILDSAVARMMEKVDFVLVGAQAVVENGGVINRIGTMQMALLARSFHKPFYVACESVKFVRHFPLTQDEAEDIVRRTMEVGDGGAGGEASSKSLQGVESHTVDLTQPELITLLVTDMGVFPPSSVSDELIHLFAPM